MLFDPKAPSDAIPECMVKYPSNCSLFGSFLYDAFLLVYVTSTLFLCFYSLPELFKSDWTIQQLLISMVLVIIGFFLGGSSIIIKSIQTNKHQNCQHHGVNGTSILDDVKLEEIAVANSLVLHRDGRVSSNTRYASSSTGLSTNAGEVC